MAYANPPRWGHGDRTVSAARMQIYSDDLTALYAAMVADHTAIRQTEASDTLAFVNLWRWLHYQSASDETATLSDPAGVGEDVTLGDSESAMASYDLSQVAWLTTGQVYTLTGVVYASEDWES